MTSPKRMARSSVTSPSSSARGTKLRKFCTRQKQHEVEAIGPEQSDINLKVVQEPLTTS